MNDSKKIHSYATGADMWLDCCINHGETTAKGICNHYLDLQIRSTSTEKMKFCKEMYAAMPK